MTIHWRSQPGQNRRTRPAVDVAGKMPLEGARPSGRWENANALSLKRTAHAILERVKIYRLRLFYSEVRVASGNGNSEPGLSCRC